MTPFKRLIPWVLISALIIGILQLFPFTPKSQKPTPAKNQPQMQWQITQVQRWQLNPNQNNQTYLKAQSAIQTQQQRQQNLEQHLSFTQPKIIITQPNQAHYIESQTGTFLQADNKQILTLNQTVKILTQDPKYTLITLTTETAHLNLKNHILQAPGFVTITQPKLKITGVGLIAHLKQQTYQLTRSVTTRYQPETQ